MAGSFQKLKLNSQHSDAVPLMNLKQDEDDDDQESDEEINFSRTNNKVISSKAKHYLTGGRRMWKFDNPRVRNRLSAIAIVFFTAVILLLLVFLVYPLLRTRKMLQFETTTTSKPDELQKPGKHQHPWDTTYCKGGMNVLIELCPCIANIDISQQYEDTLGVLADCIFNCTEEDYDYSGDYEYDEGER